VLVAESLTKDSLFAAIQQILSGMSNIINLCLAPVEHLRARNMFCRTSLRVTPMPTSTLPSPTSRSKQKAIRSNEVQTIFGDLFDAV
jgi:hypothetical protein